MTSRRGVVFGVLALGIGAGLIVRHSKLPSLEHRTTTSALADAADTRLGRAISPLVSAHPARSGIYGLREAPEAFAARALLAEAADRTLDVLYYIWRKDNTGTLLDRKAS